jgi:hypothetical protein
MRGPLAGLRDANANGISAQEGLPQVIFVAHANPESRGKWAAHTAGRAGPIALLNRIANTA